MQSRQDETVHGYNIVNHAYHMSRFHLGHASLRRSRLTLAYCSDSVPAEDGRATSSHIASTMLSHRSSGFRNTRDGTIWAQIELGTQRYFSMGLDVAVSTAKLKGSTRPVTLGALQVLLQSFQHLAFVAFEHFSFPQCLVWCMVPPKPYCLRRRSMRLHSKVYMCRFPLPIGLRSHYSANETPPVRTNRDISLRTLANRKPSSTTSQLIVSFEIAMESLEDSVFNAESNCIGDHIVIPLSW